MKDLKYPYFMCGTFNFDNKHNSTPILLNVHVKTLRSAHGKKKKTRTRTRTTSQSVSNTHTRRRGMKTENRSQTRNIYTSTFRFFFLTARILTVFPASPFPAPNPLPPPLPLTPLPPSPFLPVDNSSLTDKGGFVTEIDP